MLSVHLVRTRDRDARIYCTTRRTRTYVVHEGVREHAGGVDFARVLIAPLMALPTHPTPGEAFGEAKKGVSAHMCLP